MTYKIAKPTEFIADLRDKLEQAQRDTGVKANRHHMFIKGFDAAIALMIDKINLSIAAFAANEDAE